MNEIDFFKECQKNGDIEFQDIDVDELINLTNDKKIIHVAKEHNASIMTKDRTQNLWALINTFVFEIIQN